MKIIIDTNLWISFLIGKQTVRLKNLLVLHKHEQTIILTLTDFCELLS